jgi:hypothetical protein
MSFLENTKTQLTKIEKLNILQEYFVTDLNQSELRRKYSIGDIGYITNWISSFNILLKDIGLKSIVNTKSDPVTVDHNL